MPLSRPGYKPALTARHPDQINRFNLQPQQLNEHPLAWRVIAQLKMSVPGTKRTMIAALVSGGFSPVGALQFPISSNKKLKRLEWPPPPNSRAARPYRN